MIILNITQFFVHTMDSECKGRPLLQVTYERHIENITKYQSTSKIYPIPFMLGQTVCKMWIVRPNKPPKLGIIHFTVV